ncbi:MAG: single-stranded DNA-binding protein [Albidovulum sp.]|nr:single-stranded DNA-binding protein [Albidovulum sp.]MDE0305548.1 single-stranded DNA-binding protein [Albidovulum sp.]MDE0532898.1 single-stranded DNA-binding protein [Albidovulum sp.]
MASVNKVILVGNLGRDPEVRTFSSGGKVCNLSVATTNRWKDRESGENRERTEWHRVSILSEPLVRVAENYLRKGRQVYLEGQLETRKWTDQTGNERYTTEVVLRPFRSELQLLGSRDDASYSERPPSDRNGGHRSSQIDDVPDENDLDDNIPF